MADFVWLIISRKDDPARGLDAGSIITAISGDKLVGRTERKVFRAVRAYGITLSDALALANEYRDPERLATCGAIMDSGIDVRFKTKLEALGEGKTPVEAEKSAEDAVQALGPMPPMPPVLRKRRHRIPPEVLSAAADTVDFGKKVAVCQDMRTGKFKYKKAAE